MELSVNDFFFFVEIRRMYKTSTTYHGKTRVIASRIVFLTLKRFLLFNFPEIFMHQVQISKFF